MLQLASTQASEAIEISLRQKQSKLLDSYQAKLKRYEEKWEKLKQHAAASASGTFGRVPASSVLHVDFALIYMYLLLSIAAA